MNAPSSPVDPTRRFSNRVEYYVRSRPHYPAELLKFCQDQLHLRPEQVIADIGAGTGILSELFLDNGNPVLAVEPNAPMREAAERALSNRPHFTSRQGQAESTGLEAQSVDFVVAGQAFHWFDRPRAREEFERILRPGGWVLLIWNDRKLENQGFSEIYERVIQDFETNLKHVSHRALTATDSATMSEFFAPYPFSVATFENLQKLDLDGVIARALSSSYLPLPGQPRCDEMIARLRQEFEAHHQNGYVVQPYQTELYYGQLAKAS